MSVAKIVGGEALARAAIIDQPVIARGAGRRGKCQLCCDRRRPPSHPEIQSIAVSGEVAVVSFYADSERTDTLQASEKVEGPWTKVTDLGLRPRPQLMRIPINLSTGPQFFRLVSPSQPRPGASRNVLIHQERENFVFSSTTGKGQWSGPQPMPWTDSTYLAAPHCITLHTRTSSRNQSG